MVNWSITWLQKCDANSVKVKLWAVRKNSDFFHYNLCGNDLKNSSEGFQSIYQHSNKPNHKSLSNIILETIA